MRTAVMFQSRTGFPGHLANATMTRLSHKCKVSIPNGLPRPFSPGCSMGSGRKSNVSIPNGLPRPFSLCPVAHQSMACTSFQSRTGFPGHLAVASVVSRGAICLVSIPNGLPRPFSPCIMSTQAMPARMFQSRTGFPGHLAYNRLGCRCLRS